MGKGTPLEGIYGEFSKLAGEMFSLIDDCRSRLDEIKDEVRTTSDRAELWEALGELRLIRARLIRKRAEITDVLERKLEELERKVRIGEVGVEWLAPEQYEELKELVEEELESIEEAVEDLLEQIDGLRDETRERVRVLRRGRVAVPRVARAPEMGVPDMGSVIEEALSGDLERGPTLTVSSVRLLKADVDLIDSLVKAGIFRSRDEGVAFFVHKGIESSGNWLLRVKEKLEEIRRLQEEARRELKRALGETLEGAQSGKSQEN